MKYLKPMSFRDNDLFDTFFNPRQTMSQNLSQTNRLFWADHLRAIATIAVIMVHTSAPILYQYNIVSDKIWWIGNIIDSCMRFCVPAFLMLSGVLLIRDKINIREYFKKRFTRILYPFIFWTFLYIIWTFFDARDSELQFTFISISKSIFCQIRDGAAYHLWYIYMLIGVYLIIPILSRWIVKDTIKGVIYYLMIWGIVLLFNYPLIYKIKPNIDLSYFSGYLGYVILGYAGIFIAIKKGIKIISFFLIIIGVSITAIGTYILTKYSQHYRGEFYNYLTINVLMTTVGVFLLVKDIKINNIIYIKTISFISKYSYGIYLSHVFVLSHLSKVGITWNTINPIIGILLTTILCLSISLLLTFIISRIPFGKYISG